MLRDLDLPAIFDGPSGQITLRRATSDDLDRLMALLADDAVSASRGDVAAPDDRLAYLDALEQIIGDASNDLLVATDPAGRLVGTFQLTRIPGMARRGATRLQVEAVRVRSESRSSGIGTAMMTWVRDVAAPALGSPLVQLTSDAARADAHRFYERLGFHGSHVGFKYRVPDEASRGE
ncbi:GNAT family N-acetyltransferase [Agromyces sp. SYSU K20354]|uniref:GNAT family N-acetyltransferase n=1 Tax=Agromyces cavernae TaxID=2898659 RepID=UPI001E3FB2E9|nr:GNAT family N-acetyltransferase [Agromyces cavernae]MCD2443086.1 GNAT family N-acetyltransferase [Agromyces cavernae]